MAVPDWSKWKYAPKPWLLKSQNETRADVGVYTICNRSNPPNEMHDTSHITWTTYYIKNNAGTYIKGNTN